MLAKDEGKFFKMKSDEVDKLHESLYFLKEHNVHVRVFLTSWEQFSDLWHHIQVPAGDGKLRVRTTKTRRRGKAAVEHALNETLGDEEAALVIIDPKEAPSSWAEVAAAAEIGECRFRPTEGQEARDEDQAIVTAKAAEDVENVSYVTFGDPHLDAKVQPNLHVHGTGSLRGEEGAGALQQYLKSRLCALDRGFRDSDVWAFFNLDRLIKNDLYFRERRRRQAAQGREENSSGNGGHPGTVGDNPGSADINTGRGRKRGREEMEGDGTSAENDARTDAEAPAQKPYIFGHGDPSHIPESRGWWDRERKNLYAITEDHENGMMTGMVTVTQHDRAPELLAHIRRGPCAKPTAREKYEYLLSRKEVRAPRTHVERYPTAAVLSFQRRTLEVKANFLRANRVTPLGITKDTFDRTEAQKRNALHSHIVWWPKRRKLPDGYIRKATVPVQDPSEATSDAETEPGRQTVEDGKEDHPYYHTEAGRVHAQLVRPQLDPATPMELAQKHLLWGFLLRTIQVRGYLHGCTMRYCLLNRRCCRFFYPWPLQPEQQFDDKTQRTAYQRTYPPDDQWVVPHNLELAAFNTGTVNVVLFDPDQGADTARQYVTKYVAKPEAYQFLEAGDEDEQNPTKRFLESRMCGACMACNRLLGFRVVRCTRPVEYIWPQFTTDPGSQIPRPPEHKERYKQYPDPNYYLGPAQK